MSTITEKKADGIPADAEAALEDLEVDEVSVVDRPANKRKFLIVKNEDGSVAATIQEMDMSEKTAEVNKSEDASLLDVLGLSEPEVVADVTPVADPVKPAVEPTAPVKKDVAGLLQMLTKSANAIQDGGVEAQSAELIEIAKTLDGIASEAGGTSLGIEKQEANEQIQEALDLVLKASNTIDATEGTAISEDDANLLATASSAIVKAAGISEEECEKWPIQKGKALAALLNRQIDRKSKDRFERGDLIKKLAASVSLTPSTITQILRAEINCATKPQLQKFAGVLGMGAQALINASLRDGCRFALNKDEGQLDIQVFIEKGVEVDGKDPEIVIKAGAKMQRTRLSLLRKAVDNLNKILKELEGDKMSETPVQKDATPEVIQTPDVAKQVEEAIAKGFEALSKNVDEKLAAAITELKGETEKQIETITKRVSDVESASPGSNAGGDPQTPVEKAADGLNWKGILE